MACRVLIVDDDDLFAEFLTLLLGERPQFEVIGRAATGAQALELVAALEPEPARPAEASDTNERIRTRDDSR